MLEFKIKDLTTLNDNAVIDEHNWDVSMMKFIVFEYLIPLPVFPPIKRISKIHCLNKTAAVEKLGLKYSIFNSVVCWIGFPFGPVEMLASNKKNKTGIDLTEYISSKITLEDIEAGILKLPVYESDFIAIDKDTHQGFKEKFSQLKQEGIITSNPLIGYVKLKGKHIFYIGFTKDEILNKDLIESTLYKEFDKRSTFNFVDLAVDNQLTKKMSAEGFELVLD